MAMSAQTAVFWAAVASVLSAMMASSRALLVLAFWAASKASTASLTASWAAWLGSTSGISCAYSLTVLMTLLPKVTTSSFSACLRSPQAQWRSSLSAKAKKSLTNSLLKTR